jgi:hypothetical protein
LNVEIEKASLRSGEKATVVTVLGELDLSMCDHLGGIVEGRYPGGPVILDLAKCSLDDEALVQMMEIADMAANGKPLRIVAPHDSQIAHGLMVRGVEARLRVFETRDGALASLARPDE